MRAPCSLILLTAAGLTPATHAATQTTQAMPAAVVSAQAFRCQDESGRFQYQQWACANQANAQQVKVQDARTDEQHAQARRMAVREQDLARHVSYVRTQQERRSIEATAKAKQLTVPPRHAATASPPVTQGVTVAPRKRDFRAVSAKTQKRSPKIKTQTKSSAGHQTG